MRDFLCSFFFSVAGFRVVFAGRGRADGFSSVGSSSKLKSPNASRIAGCAGGRHFGGGEMRRDAQHFDHLLFIIHAQTRPAFRQQQIVQPRGLPQRLAQRHDHRAQQRTKHIVSQVP
jgi:hypothetical protein